MPPRVRRVDGDYHFHAYDFTASQAFTLGPAQPNRNNLRFYSMERDLYGLLLAGQNRGVPNIALTNAGPSTYGRNIRVLSFGNRTNNANAVNVTFTGGIHAREWIAPEIAYLIAEYLIINYTNAPQNRYAATLKGLVDSRNIQIIPMQNPDGNYHTVFGTGNTDNIVPRDWRKNRIPLPTTGLAWVQALDPAGAGNPLPFQNVGQAGGSASYDVPSYEPGPPNFIPPNLPPPGGRLHRVLPNGRTGVDINRNFDTGAWGYDCGTNWLPDSDDYFGPRRTSESETQAIEAALAGHPPRVMIDYHAYYGAILYPSEAFNNNVVNADYIAFGLSLRALTRSQNFQSYRLGSPRQVINYEATGTVIDHAERQHLTRAVTIELDPFFNNQGAAGFSLPENMIRTVFEKNIRGALVALAVPDAVSRQIVVNDFLTWNVFGRGNRLPS